jgi:hypothetical protein
MMICSSSLSPDHATGLADLLSALLLLLLLLLLQSHGLSSLLAQQSQQMSDWSLLALFLAEQLYLCDKAGSSSSSSAWAPYIRVLPRSPIGTVLDWSQKQVRNDITQQHDSLLACWSSI